MLWIMSYVISTCKLIIHIQSPLTSYVGLIKCFRDNFKTQPQVDQRFRLVSVVLNNANRPEPDRTAGQRVVKF